MKKFLATLIALAIVISSVSLMAVPAFAAESYGYMNDEYQYGDGEISVGYRSYSTFELDIPLYADDSMSGRITASNPNLEPGYQIEIRVTNLNDDGTLPMVNETTGYESAVYIYNSMEGTCLTFDNPVLAAFASEDFDESATATVEFWISRAKNHFEVDAGYYTGVICYRIECNPA